MLEVSSTKNWQNTIFKTRFVILLIHFLVLCVVYLLSVFEVLFILLCLYVCLCLFMSVFLLCRPRCLK